MNWAQFLFLAELNDFLPKKWKTIPIIYAVEDHATIKHVIESLGVPHCEVNHLLVNDRPVDFSYHIRDDDQITIFPISLPAGVQDILLQIDPRSVSRFVLDNHLGRLAAYLRMLGFDTLYSNAYQDDELARIASQDMRTLLTRDRRLLMRKAILSGYWVRRQDPQGQVIEVTRRFAMQGRIHPFQRCLRCNHPLEAVAKEVVLPRLEPLTRLYYDEFHICPECNQIYWKGSHYAQLQALLLKLSEQ